MGNKWNIRRDKLKIWFVCLHRVDYDVVELYMSIIIYYIVLCVYIRIECISMYIEGREISPLAWHCTDVFEQIEILSWYICKTKVEQEKETVSGEIKVYSKGRKFMHEIWKRDICALIIYWHRWHGDDVCKWCRFIK